MLVHHYYPSASSNVGDSLVAYAIQKALRRTLGPLDIVPIPVNPRHAKEGEATGLLETNVHRSNREADLLVVGGSNLLEPRRMSRRALRQQSWHWGVETQVEALEQIRVPLVLVGLGTGSDWAAPILPYTAKAASEVRVLFQKAIATAVRDEPTRRELLKLGISTTCTGCPVTFLTDRPVQADLEKPLIVSLPPARILKSWSGRWFMHQTMNYIRWLIQRGVDFLITLHERADLQFAPKWLPRGLPTFYTEEVSELIGRYEESSGVIGFRLHAALLGLGLGKPILPVNVDWRGRGFTHTFGLQDLALEPGTWGGFQKLRHRTEILLQGESELTRRLREQKATFQRRFESFLTQVAQQFKHASRNAA